MYLRKVRKRELSQRDIILQLVVSHLKKNPCKDCGEGDITVLTFDHVRGIKKNDIGNMLRGKHSLSTVRNEIRKCDIRCANCHLRKTGKQFGWRKHLLA